MFIFPATLALAASGLPGPSIHADSPAWFTVLGHRVPWAAVATDEPDPAVVALLDELEAAGADLATMRASIRYRTEDPILGGRETRFGRLVLERRGAKAPQRMALHIDRVSKGRRMETRHEAYLFDGLKLVELDFARHQAKVHHLNRGGEPIDPFKLGEGPMPLPLGQTREDVLRLFVVTLDTAERTGLLKDLVDVDGLHLVPKPGTSAADDYRSIDVFYDRHTRMPVGIHAICTNDAIKSVRLADLEPNVELVPDDLAALDVPTLDPTAWTIDD